jgi:hypothetical protein
LIRGSDLPGNGREPRLTEGQTLSQYATYVIDGAQLSDHTGDGAPLWKY